jgi:RNA ligase (TIGR02306 family)
MTMRQLVSIKTVTDIQPIPEADRIEVATIDGGWKVVVKKQEFEINDKCLYFEIDSILPTQDPRFSFLDKDAKNFEWGRGARLRTIKLKKQISQGLALPIKVFQYEIDSGKDLTKILGVRKWEDSDTIGENPEQENTSKKQQGKFLRSLSKIMPKFIRGRYMGFVNSLYKNTKGDFPNFIRKTDQERVQSWNKFFSKEENLKKQFEVTIKMDGSSLTVYKNKSDIGICSRNMTVWKKVQYGIIKRMLGFKNNKIKLDSNFTKVAAKTNIVEALEKLNMNIAVQGEMVGPGANGNRAFLKDLEYHIFDVFDIDKQCYVGYLERLEILKKLKENGFTGNIVHEVAFDTLEKLDLTSIEKCLKFAESVKLPGNDNIVEGIVFKSSDGKISFKAVSNEYLLKWKL